MSNENPSMLVTRADIKPPYALPARRSDADIHHDSSAKTAAVRPSAAVPKMTFACALTAPLPVPLALADGAALFVAVTMTVVCAPLVVLELAMALVAEDADEAATEDEDEAEDAVDDEDEAEADVDPELLAVAIELDEPELAEVDELPPVRYLGGGTTLDWSTSAPTPHEIFWPSGWVSFAGVVTEPSDAAIVKRVVQVRFLGAAGVENW